MLAPYLKIASVCADVTVSWSPAGDRICWLFSAGGAFLAASFSFLRESQKTHCFPEAERPSAVEREQGGDFGGKVSPFSCLKSIGAEGTGSKVGLTDNHCRKFQMWCPSLFRSLRKVVAQSLCVLPVVAARGQSTSSQQVVEAGSRFGKKNVPPGPALLPGTLQSHPVGPRWSGRFPRDLCMGHPGSEIQGHPPEALLARLSHIPHRLDSPYSRLLSTASGLLLRGFRESWLTASWAL